MLIKLVKSAKEDRHRYVSSQNERKKWCWGESSSDGQIISVTSCSFVWEVL